MLASKGALPVRGAVVIAADNNRSMETDRREGDAGLEEVLDVPDDEDADAEDHHPRRRGRS